MLRNRGTTLVEIVMAIILTLFMLFPVTSLIRGGGHQSISTMEESKLSIEIILLMEKIITESMSSATFKEGIIGGFKVEFSSGNESAKVLKISSVHSGEEDHAHRKRIGLEFERTIITPEYGLISDYELGD